MGKKKADVMAQQKEKFIAGAAARGHAREKAQELWEYIEPFAGYGFNKSHSVAYAMLAYKTAYLKAHYPEAFMAAMLNSELSSSDAIAKYTAECRHMGIEVLPPDVNESGYEFTVVGRAIRFGLGAVKGVGRGAVEAVLAARHRVGRFKSLAQLASEVDSAANRKVFECFVKAGCFDGLGVHRAALWASLDRTLDWAQRRRREREEGQSSLFGMLGGGGQSLEPSPDATTPPWSEAERLRAEKETLGLYLTGNPLSEHEATLARLVTHTTATLEGAEGTVVVGGMVTQVRRVKIKSGANAGKLMGRFVLEDLAGGLPVTLFASQLQQFGHLCEEEAIVLVKGSIRERGSEVELAVEDIQRLDQAAGRSLVAIELAVDAAAVPPSGLLGLRNLLLDHPGPVRVTLAVQLPDKSIRIAPREGFRVAFDERLAASIEGLLGEGSVRQLYGGAAG